MPRTDSEGMVSHETHMGRHSLSLVAITPGVYCVLRLPGVGNLRSPLG